MNCGNFKPTTLQCINTLCVRDYLFLKKNVKNAVKIYVLFLDTAHHYET